MEMPIFDFTTIANATNNFSSSNKIGEGGFGPVYKVRINHDANLYSGYFLITALIAI